MKQPGDWEQEIYRNGLDATRAEFAEMLEQLIVLLQTDLADALSEAKGETDNEPP